jgi:hypothetical protein
MSLENQNSDILVALLTTLNLKYDFYIDAFMFQNVIW